MVFAKLRDELGLRRVWTDYVHSAKKAEISRAILLHACLVL